MTLPSYAVTFRGFPACPCQVAWLPVYEAELLRRGVFKGTLPIAQLIGTYAKSSNTHSKGGVGDWWETDNPDLAVWVARQMGADATWHRPYNWDSDGGAGHIHSVLTGCPHNEPARYQIDAVRAGFNGLGHLGHGGPDDGPRPLSGRTWREGVAWAQRQQQKGWFEMATKAELKQAIREVLAEDGLVESPANDADFGGGNTSIVGAIKRIWRLSKGA